MPRLKLYYGGWVALPAALCQELRLETGSELEAELVNETVVLRPILRKTGVRPESAPEPARAAPPPATTKSAPVVRRAGRESSGTLAVLPPTLKSRGRRKGSGAASAPQA
jgi:hypothetical protein